MHLVLLAAETVDAGPYGGIAAVAGFLVAVVGFLKLMTDRKDVNSVTADALRQMRQTANDARSDKAQAEANEERALAALEAKTQAVTQCNQKIRELEQELWRWRNGMEKSGG